MELAGCFVGCMGSTRKGTGILLSGLLDGDFPGDLHRHRGIRNIVGLFDGNRKIPWIQSRCHFGTSSTERIPAVRARRALPPNSPPTPSPQKKVERQGSTTREQQAHLPRRDSTPISAPLPGSSARHGRNDPSCPPRIQTRNSCTASSGPGTEPVAASETLHVTGPGARN